MKSDGKNLKKKDMTICKQDPRDSNIIFLSNLNPTLTPTRLIIITSECPFPNPFSFSFFSCPSYFNWSLHKQKQKLEVR